MLLATAGKIVRLRGECDVIGGGQKGRVDQAPSGGENVRVPYTEFPHQSAIDVVFVQLKCG